MRPGTSSTYKTYYVATYNMLFTFQHPLHRNSPPHMVNKSWHPKPKKPNKSLECEIFANGRIFKGNYKNLEFLRDHGYQRKIVYWKFLRQNSPDVVRHKGSFSLRSKTWACWWAYRSGIGAGRVSFCLSSCASGGGRASCLLLFLVSLILNQLQHCVFGIACRVGIYTLRHPHPRADICAVGWWNTRDIQKDSMNLVTLSFAHINFSILTLYCLGLMPIQFVFFKVDINK